MRPPATAVVALGVHNRLHWLTLDAIAVLTLAGQDGRQWLTLDMRRDPHLHRSTAAPPRARPGGRARNVVPAVVAGALAWLLVGCCGLLWTIAFTTDPRSMTIGLVVWVFCFVAPSTLATVAAYRLDEAARDRDRKRTGRRQAARRDCAHVTMATGD